MGTDSCLVSCYLQGMKLPGKKENSTKCQMDSFMYSMSMPGAPPNNLSAGVGSQTEFVQTARRECQFLQSNFSDCQQYTVLLTPFFSTLTKLGD